MEYNVLGMYFRSRERVYQIFANGTPAGLTYTLLRETHIGNALSFGPNVATEGIIVDPLSIQSNIKWSMNAYMNFTWTWPE